MPLHLSLKRAVLLLVLALDMRLQTLLSDLPSFKVQAYKEHLIPFGFVRFVSSPFSNIPEPIATLICFESSRF